MLGRYASSPGQAPTQEGLIIDVEAVRRNTAGVPVIEGVFTRYALSDPGLRRGTAAPPTTAHRPGRRGWGPNAALHRRRLP